MLCAVLCAAFLSAPMPAAGADPPPKFPDLSEYTPMSTDQYQTYSAYMTRGLQFVTPDGYRCRMSFTHKQNGAHMNCWGSLPGTPDNLVGLDYLGIPDAPGATFSDTDLSAMERYESMDGEGNWHDGTVNPADYKPLPAHSKLTYTDGPLQTCAVDELMTACLLTDQNSGRQHGFVLSPQDSWTF